MAASSGRVVQVIAFAIAVGGCSSSDAPQAASTTRSAGPLRITGVAPNGQAYPQLLGCESTDNSLTVYAGDVALLGVVGVSSEPDGATPLAHYRSSLADLKAKVIAELQRHRAAGLVACDPAVCDDRDACGLVVTDIYPYTPDGFDDGSVMAPPEGRPLRWQPSADYRRVTYATSDRGPTATRAVWITVGCDGGCKKRPASR
jgi:hypothetical protein